MGRAAQATEASKNGAYIKDADKTPDNEFSQYTETHKRSLMSQELSKGKIQRMFFVYVLNAFSGAMVGT
jgi:hypothetical protein